jgi:hypothetical protein
MGIDERRRLLEESIPADPARPESPRYAFRLGEHGLEWFCARFTQMVGGEAEFHGFPCDTAPTQVLRRMRDEGRLTEAQYRKALKELG